MSTYKKKYCFKLFAVTVFGLFYMIKSETLCNLEIEDSLKTLLTPQQNPSIQLQALRRDLLKSLQNAIDKTEENYLLNWSYDPQKRNLEALARAGYLKTLPEDKIEDNTDHETESDLKRSLANLAKNGQLPIKNSDDNIENVKRGIQSLARNGELQQNKHFQKLLEDISEKRNLQSIARNFELPSYGKRNIASLRRLQEIGKRNLASLLRNAQYLNSINNGRSSVELNPHESVDVDKRNLQAIKAQQLYSPSIYKRSTNQNNQREKRQAYYDDDDNEQNDINQYATFEKIVRELNQIDPTAQKRFLGSTDKPTEWYKSPKKMSDYYHSKPDKRHIASLARLGWLPTVRSIRRYNRSERSTYGDHYYCNCDREVASNGKNKNYSPSENEIPLNHISLIHPTIDRTTLIKSLQHNKPDDNYYYY